METLSFSGHETFPFRYGWLKKGLDSVATTGREGFFGAEDSMIQLGVGKNMVQSIRHWCIAAGLIKPVGHRSGKYAPTKLGQKLFLSPGYDPHLEDPATLWLLHWQIASNRTSATTWYWLFNLWHSSEFTKAQLAEEITRWIEMNGIRQITPNTLSRDLDTCVRTYVHSRQNTGIPPEDSFSCPLTELNLIFEINEGNAFQISRGDQKSLPNEIFLFGVTKFWNETSDNANSISLEKLTYDPCSPGKIFKLDGEAIARRLEVLSITLDGKYFFEEKNGLKQLYRRERIEPYDWLDVYYGSGF